MAVAIGLVVLAYLLGSLASAVIVSRLMGLPDPRGLGSGNPGATNVLRHGGKTAAALTLAGDLGKGLLPVLIGRGAGVGPEVLAAMGLAAFLGHLYPVFFGLRGGKGVATAFGVLLGLAWPLALAVLATWMAMALVFRYSSLAALSAAGLAPVYAWWITPRMPYLIAIGLMCLLLIWRHRSNVRKLLDGTEDRIGGTG